eukprot:TRINITY_DN6734_c0_g1_i1.p1 TRINITY_DN6734_c0_g1~~TRINITY_DN6734_c0_g1_i1.p1  ORF type:complete len:275 (-),score=34.60 TRINITY_DN6734_c0_g1_i1:160-984(-)
MKNKILDFLNKLLVDYKLAYKGLLAYIVFALYVLNMYTSSALWNYFGCGISILNILGILTLTSLLVTHYRSPGIITDEQWDSNDIAAGSSISQWELCKKCDIVIPARSAHCKQINQCVLKYDHFCPWSDSPIGFFNYKPYMLLLIYGFIAVIGEVLASFMHIYLYFTSYITDTPTWHTYTLLFLSTGVGFALGNLWHFHCLLVTMNFTTKEYYVWKERAKLKARNNIKPKPYSRYDVGKLENWKQVFGNDYLWWWCPWRGGPMGDGYKFQEKEI